MKFDKHQRDYTILGTTLVLRHFHHPEINELFHYNTKETFMIIDKGILYHFLPEEDALQRVIGWSKFNGTVELLKIKEETLKKLKEYRAFFEGEHPDPFASMEKLNYYFRYFLAPILLSSYLPEHSPEELKEICLELRSKTEHVHKVGMDLQKKLLLDIEKEKNIPKDTLQYLTIDEFEEFIKTGFVPNVNKRNEYVLIRITTFCEVFYDKETEKFFGLRGEELEILSELKGRIAYKGIATGKVRIIRKVEDASKLEEGEILVTSMTDPRYVPAMKKAAAIITNEGGITCHAAIVARELKKPCIIGTKIATHALHQGDLIEVNAETGTIKILEKN